MTGPEDQQAVRLARELLRLPAEAPWVEFKHNNDDPDMIGRTVSALSNAAALEGRQMAYLVWGVEDLTHAAVGTTFHPQTARKGGEDLLAWLMRNLTPRHEVRCSEALVDGARLVILEVPCATGRPTMFVDREYIRINSQVRQLRDHPEHERRLWDGFNLTPFEHRSAMDDVSGADVTELLDGQAFFQLIKLTQPADRAGVLERLQAEQMIRRNDAGRWTISNLGAILFARDLRRFTGLARKGMRLIVYRGTGRTETVREQVGQRGYAAGFEGLIGFLEALLPRNEEVGRALRRDVTMYPVLAVRELIANALIHQDFSIGGTGPMLEVFDDRIEFTNPGRSLTDVARLLDQPPRSRNEALAAFMRRIGICEERGSGVDKVVSQTEFYQLPPPLWEEPGAAVRVVLFAHRDFRRMDREERIRACYLHACLRHVMRETMTNTSVRERFGIAAENPAMASRIIRDTLDAGLIRPYDQDQGKRNARYLPHWA